jgi:integrase/recombinase XerD
MLFKEFDIFLAALKAERRISKNTILAYSQDLNILQPFLINSDITSFSTEINYMQLLQNVYLSIKPTTSSATLARRMSTYVQFFKFLGKEILHCDIQLDPPKQPQHHNYVPFLENNHLEKIRVFLSKQSSFKYIRLSAIIEILYSTGMRISELLALKQDCIKKILQHNHLLICGKGGSERYVFFSIQSIAALKQYISFFKIDNQDFLFFSSLGRLSPVSRKQALTRQRVFQLLKELAHNISLDSDIVFAHAFRHRMLTNLVIGGADIISVQKIAGHKQVNTTARYTHIEDYLYEDIKKFHPLEK